MRKRQIVRKAVKAAIIRKAAQRVGHRLEKRLTKR